MRTDIKRFLVDDDPTNALNLMQELDLKTENEKYAKSSTNDLVDITASTASRLTYILRCKDMQSKEYNAQEIERHALQVAVCYGFLTSYRIWYHERLINKKGNYNKDALEG